MLGRKEKNKDNLELVTDHFTMFTVVNSFYVGYVTWTILNVQNSFVATRHLDKGAEGV